MLDHSGSRELFRTLCSEVPKTAEKGSCVLLYIFHLIVGWLCSNNSTQLVETAATTVTAVQFWQLAAAASWLLLYKTHPILLHFSKQQISAALTILTISALAVNKERRPDFHGREFERVPHPVPRSPNNAVVMGSAVPPCCVETSIEIYSVAPWNNNVGEGKRRLCWAWEDVALL